MQEVGGGCMSFSIMGDGVLHLIMFGSGGGWRKSKQSKVKIDFQAGLFFCVVELFTALVNSSLKKLKRMEVSLIGQKSLNNIGFPKSASNETFIWYFTSGSREFTKH
jgi:hypothetical protein